MVVNVVLYWIESIKNFIFISNEGGDQLSVMVSGLRRRMNKFYE